MKRVFKYLAYSLLSIVGFVLLYLLAAFCLSSITINAEANQPPDVAIYIKSNGVHTDLVVPVKNEQYNWSEQVLFSNTLSQDSSMQYLAMGWGDKGFYLETPEWSDLKASVAFKAAFALGTTAIHATFYRQITEGEACKKIMIGSEQYDRLVSYIMNSFQKDSTGRVIKINTHANYGNTDAFYEANGSYSMLHTCNTWANSGLKAAGQKACLWAAFDTGIFKKYR